MTYRGSFKERDYKIMIDKEHNGIKLSEIAKAQRVSVNAIRSHYLRASRTRKNLYFWAIREAVGMSVEETERLNRLLLEEYLDHLYICAYLEQEYKDILTAFREGEPGVPEKYIENLPPLRRNSTPELCCNSSDTPRKELDQEELFVLEKREKGITFEKIGAMLGVTGAKAQSIYLHATHVQMNSDIDIICKETGQSIHEITNWLHSVPGDFRRWPKYLKKEYEEILRKTDGE